MKVKRIKLAIRCDAPLPSCRDVHPWMPVEIQTKTTFNLCEIAGISIWDREKVYRQLKALR